MSGDRKRCPHAHGGRHHGHPHRFSPLRLSAHALGGGDTGSVPLTQPGGEKLVLCKAPGYLQNLVLALDIPLICALPLCPHLSTQDASTTSDWAPPQNTPCFMFPSSFSPSS